MSKRTIGGGKNTAGLQVDQVRRLKEIEQENAKLNTVHRARLALGEWLPRKLQLEAPR